MTLPYVRYNDAVQIFRILSRFIVVLENLAIWDIHRTFAICGTRLSYASFYMEIIGPSWIERCSFLVLLPLFCVFFLGASSSQDASLESVGPTLRIDCLWWWQTSSTMLAFKFLAASILLPLMGYHWLPYGAPTSRRRNHRLLFPSRTTGRKQVVPVVVVENTRESMSKRVQKSLETYHAENHKMLETLSRALDVAREAHSIVAWNQLQTKLDTLAHLFEKDSETMGELLKLKDGDDDFVLTRALPSEPNERQDNCSSKHLKSTDFVWPTRGIEHIPYDSIRQVVAHLVRDWSAEGATSRNPLYQWVVAQLLQHKMPTDGAVVVPGAGLGRLAYEIATSLRRPVEAVESSVIMVLMASKILRMSKRNCFRLCPYAADPFANEVDSSLRYASIEFPDVVPFALLEGLLSFTLGEFSQLVLSRNNYAAVVTCFFLDTATTFFDYLTTIEHMLRKGGLFINVGPLHWHPNSRLPLAADELKEILEDRTSSNGQRMFEILHWSIDDVPLKYRDHRMGASTLQDAYFPIRFVLRKV